MEYAFGFIDLEINFNDRNIVIRIYALFQTETDL